MLQSGRALVGLVLQRPRERDERSKRRRNHAEDQTKAAKRNGFGGSSFFSCGGRRLVGSRKRPRSTRSFYVGCRKLRVGRGKSLRGSYTFSCRDRHFLLGFGQGDFSLGRCNV